MLSTGSGVYFISKFPLASTSYDDFLEALKRPDLTVEDARYLEEQMSLAAAVVPIMEASFSLKRGRQTADDAPVRGLGAGYPWSAGSPSPRGGTSTRATFGPAPMWS